MIKGIFKKTVSFAIIAAGLAVPKAHAQDEDAYPRPGISIGGRAAYSQPRDADEGSWFGGAQLRFYFSRVFAIEGSADYRRSKFPGTTVHTYPVQASLLFYLIPNRVVTPFLLGGAGWYFTSVDRTGGTDTSNRFGAHAGAGLQGWLNEHWSIDATYRYVWVEKIQTKDSALLNKDFEDRGHMGTAALNFHF